MIISGKRFISVLCLCRFPLFYSSHTHLTNTYTAHGWHFRPSYDRLTAPRLKRQPSIHLPYLVAHRPSCAEASRVWIKHEWENRSRNSDAISRTLTGCSCCTKVQSTISVTRPEKLPTSVARWFKENDRQVSSMRACRKLHLPRISLSLPRLSFHLSLSVSLRHTWKCGKGSWLWCAFHTPAEK